MSSIFYLIKCRKNQNDGTIQRQFGPHRGRGAGIGRATALAFSKAGPKVVIADVGLIILCFTRVDEGFSISINSSVILMIRIGMPEPFLKLPGLFHIPNTPSKM